MKTFWRYLLSYVGMLLIPIALLSIVFFALTGRYYSEQLAKSNASALAHARESVELQTSQLDACAYQTVQIPAFSTSKLESEDYAAQFSLREYLTNWNLTNAFIQDLYYTSSDARYIYSCSARYSAESFAKYQLGGHIAEEDVKALVENGHGQRWVSLGEESAPVLLYISAARYSSASMHYLISKIDYQQLSALVRDASGNQGGVSYLCDQEGRLLLAMGEGEESYRDAIPSICADKEDWGKLRFAGEEMLFARIQGGSLVFIDLSPRNAAWAGYHRMSGAYLGGLALIIFLGVGLGYFFMNVNYTPLRRIGELSSQIVPGAVDNGDMVQGAIKTLNILQESRYEMLDKSRVLLREKLIMRLLMGRYATREAFDADAAEAELALAGERWVLLSAFGVDFSNDGEETVIAAVGRAYGPLSAHMRLFMPENSSMLFVLPAQKEDGRLEALRDALTAAGLETAVSRVCDSPAQLGNAYAELYSAPDNSEEVRVQLEALRSAVGFEEPERIYFSLNTIRRVLADGRKGDYFEVLRSAYSLLLAGGYDEAARTVREELTAMLYEEQTDSQRIFQRLEELLLSCTGEEARKQRKPLISKMLSYLEENCCSENFSIQDMAERFGLSLSNLSHYFKKYEDVSISDWVKRRRVEVAQDLLTGSDLSVTEVSERVGYWQPGSFTRAFKSVTGVTPVQYRKRGGPDEE